MFPEFSLPTVVYGMAALLFRTRMRLHRRPQDGGDEKNGTASDARSLYPHESSRIQTFQLPEPARRCRRLRQSDAKSFKPRAAEKESIDDDKAQAGATRAGGFRPWAGVHGHVGILRAVRRLGVARHDPPRDRPWRHVSGHSRHLWPVQE